MPVFLAPLAAWLFAIFSRLLLLFGRMFLGVKTSLVGWFVFLITIGFSSLVVQLLITLGIGFITYNLGTFALNTLYIQIQQSLTGMPSDFLMLVKLARIDEAISILFGALSGRLALSGLRGGSIRRPTAFNS